MMTAPTEPTFLARTCTRGCLRTGMHDDGCPIDDCGGCMPRRAVAGRLCGRCHGRLSEWLKWAHIGSCDRCGRTADHLGPCRHCNTTEGGIINPASTLRFAYHWLGQNLTGYRGNTRDTKITYRRDPPTPLALATWDAQQNIKHTLRSWSQLHTDYLNATGPETTSILDMVRWMSNNLSRIEHHEAIGDMWDEFNDAIRAAHQLAPWRGDDQHQNTPCPDCEQPALVKPAGSLDVECRHCGAYIDHQQYQRWCYILADIQRSGAPS